MRAQALGAVLVSLAAAGALGPSSTAAGGQGAGACRQPLVNVTAPERSYANLAIPDLEGRLFVYVPDIQSTNGGFTPFQLWIVEGVYGRPFVDQRGPMDGAAFERLRRSGNVRATPVGVGRNGQTQQVVVAKRPLVVEVNVAAGGKGGDTVTARICRP
jgi:hypothetical protein